MIAAKEISLKPCDFNVGWMSSVCLSSLKIVPSFGSIHVSNYWDCCYEYADATKQFFENVAVNFRDARSSG